MKFRIIIVTGIILIANGTVRCGYAQSLDQAKKLYNEGAYEEAKPAFEKLAKQSPANPSYNLWYGVCCFETGDYGVAEKHLLVANRREVSDSYRYLADIYTTSYRFAEAVDVWERYIALLKKKQEDTEAYEKQLAYVEKLLRMKENVEDIQVIDSMVVHKDQLLATYFLSSDCGSLQYCADFFQAAASQSVVYINPKGDQAYYGRPDDNGRYALYTQSKIMDIWTDENPIFPSDNSDNNYPFVLGDGRTLYFASKGNGSIGGYDLFVTRYRNNSYLMPEQLGMPFNSTANDYMMVIDEAKEIGWFVSDRNQPEGKVCIYLFIPDESRKRITENSDDAWLCRRATLNSIKETWIENNRYAPLIAEARTNESETTPQMIQRDFDFFVNENINYYSWDDFKSPEAKSFYQKAENTRKQIESVEQKLTESRDKYAAGNAMRNQLRSSILKAEEDLVTLYKQMNEWIKKARNTENIHLSKRL